jgi:hypothetical protein
MLDHSREAVILSKGKSPEELVDDRELGLAIVRLMEIVGEAGTQTEAIRQAILAYERMIEEEEQIRVHKAVEIEMMELNASKVKIHSFQEIKKSLGSGR